MNLNTDSWKDFVVGEIFDCHTTKAIDINYVTKGDIPYITRSAVNNGCSGSIGNNEHINSGNCITIGAEGKKAFYQPLDFVAGVKVYTLRNKNLNVYNAMFVVALLNRLEYIYSYGRARVLEKIKNEIIKLPQTDSGEVDWKYMESYIKTLQHKKISTKIPLTELGMITSDYNYYLLSDLFEIKKGKRLTKADMIPGNTNFLGAISDNNGVREKIEADFTWDANCITVNYNGSVGEAFYQAEPFWASDDVNVLYPKNWELNKYIAMFIITVIKANRFKFGYGRKWTKEKMSESYIKLPSKSDGTPNFEYMESYIKSLPYSDRI